MALEFQTKAPSGKVRAPASTGDRWRQIRDQASGGGRMSAAQRMFLTEQLSLLLETGSSLHAALRTLAEQADQPALRRVLAGLQDDVSEGRTFAIALARHPDVFSTTYVNLVAAGEAGGFLDEVLRQLLRMEERSAELRKTLVSAFTYPAFLVAFSLAVVVFVLVVVFPKFGKLFESIRDQLPFSTLVLMHASESIRGYWPVWLAVFGGGGTGLWVWTRSAVGRAITDRLKLTVPGVRRICIELYLAQTLRVLSLSLTNGVSPVEALAGCRDVIDNAVFRRFVAGVEARVNQGAGIAAGFREAVFIPPVVQQMIATGEESGRLGLVTGRLADYYERELQNRLNLLARLVEPIMLLVMGVVVGLIVSSLILPIFKLSRAVG